jgi:hypothetical protein
MLVKEDASMLMTLNPLVEIIDEIAERVGKEASKGGARRLMFSNLHPPWMMKDGRADCGAYKKASDRKGSSGDQYQCCRNIITPTAPPILMNPARDCMLTTTLPPPASIMPASRMDPDLAITG